MISQAKAKHRTREDAGRTHARTHARTQARTHERTHARTHTHTRTHTHARTHARTHTYAHARTHARTHTRTHQKTMTTTTTTNQQKATLLYNTKCFMCIFFSRFIVLFLFVLQNAVSVLCSTRCVNVQASKRNKADAYFDQVHTHRHATPGNRYGVWRTQKC